jgi:hypothetical protein
LWVLRSHGCGNAHKIKRSFLFVQAAYCSDQESVPRNAQAAAQGCSVGCMPEQGRLDSAVDGHEFLFGPQAVPPGFGLFAI